MHNEPILVASLSLPQHLAARVRGIQDGGHDRFGTAVIVSGNDKELTQPHWEKWLEGRKDAQTGLWTVKQHRAFTGGGDAPHQTETKQRDVCFFDALYYCAQFEQQEKILGRALPAEIGQQKFPHYAEAAAAAKQPLDLNGLPHPAMDGEILTDGNFTNAQMELAAQAKNVAIVKASNTTLLSLTSSTQARVEIQPLAQSFNTKLSKQNDIAQVRSAIYALDALFEELKRPVSRRDISNRLFDTGDSDDTFLQIIPTVCTLGVWYFWARKTGKAFVGFDNAIEKSSERAEQAIAKLPEGEDKKLLTQFRLAAQASYPLELAAYQYQIMKKTQILPAEAQAKAFTLIDVAVERGCFAGSQAEDLKNSWLQGAFVPNLSEIPSGENEDYWRKIYNPLRDKWFGHDKLCIVGERKSLLARLEHAI